MKPMALMLFCFACLAGCRERQAIILRIIFSLDGRPGKVKKSAEPSGSKLSRRQTLQFNSPNRNSPVVGQSPKEPMFSHLPSRHTKLAFSLDK